MRYLKYQTTHDVLIGPFIKSTDGYSVLTGLTTGTVDIVYFGGTGNSSGSYSTVNDSFSEDASGYYSLGIGTGMTANIGPLRICYTASSGLPSWDDFTVVNPNVYESLFSATGDDYLYTDVQQMAAVAITTDAADNFDNFFFDNDAQSTRRLSELCNTGDLLTTGDIMECNVVSMASASLTSEAGDNFTTWFDNAGVAVGKDIGDVSTMTTANLGELSTFDPASDNVIASTQSSVNVHSIGGTTATINTGVVDVNIEQVAGTTVADINDFVASGYTIGTGDRPLGDLYTAMSAYILGDSTYDGTTVAYYTSDGGTELWSAVITTDERDVTTN